MPSCGTLANRYEPCKQFVGGLKGAFIIPFEFANRVDHGTAFKSV